MQKNMPKALLPSAKFAIFAQQLLLGSIMKMKTKNRTLTAMLVGGIAVASLLTGCVKQEDEIFTENAPESAEKASKQIFGDSIVLGERLNNPYSIQNMQAAYNQVMATRGDAIDEVTLQPNLLYVRFLPQDSADVAFLQESGLELFDYPLDYDIVVMGDSYHDPSLPDTALTWQYSCVRPGFTFPDMTYEVIEECFVPDEETSSTRAGIDWDEVEETAIQNADLPEKYMSSGTSATRAAAKVNPKGKFRVEDGNGGLYPIEGAKVRCNYLVNISTTYTKADGTYEIPKAFSHDPNYSLIYENTKDFVIWGNMSVLSPADHRFGSRDKSGLTKDIKTDDDAWKWAVINVAACDYYNECQADGIKLPPNNLKIMSIGFTGDSSAPMLRRVNGIAIASELASAMLIQGGVSAVSVIGFESAFVLGLPDITIGTKEGRTFDNIYYSTYHELTHASHFAQAGESVWGPYINYIVTSWASGNGCYGDGTSTSKGRDICELGESWAYANESFLYYSKKGTYYIFGARNWYSNPIIGIYDLIINNVLTRKQINDCMTSDIKSINDLKNKLNAKYPSKKTIISMAL